MGTRRCVCKQPAPLAARGQSLQIRFEGKWTLDFREEISYLLKGRFTSLMKKDTKTQLLDAAQRLVQTRGHNGFSFRHLSKEVGIRTASVHYYFPTKTDLAVALVRRYRKGLDDAMADIAVRKDSLAARLDSTIGLYTDTLSNESRICLCAALAGEYLSLPRPVRIELQGLIEDGEKWIARLLTEGRARGEIAKDTDPFCLARLWYAALQGALLVSRAAGSEILRDAAAALKALTLNRR